RPRGRRASWTAQASVRDRAERRAVARRGRTAGGRTGSHALPLVSVLVLDTGPLFAALDADDPDHERCAALLAQPREDLVVPTPVLVELDYFVSKLLGVETWVSFVEDVFEGAYRLEEVDERMLKRAAELEQTYASLPLGL